MSLDIKIRIYISTSVTEEILGPQQCNSTHTGHSSRMSDQAKKKKKLSALFSMLGYVSLLWDFASHTDTFEQGKVVADAAYLTKETCDRMMMQLLIRSTWNTLCWCCLYTNKILHLKKITRGELWPANAKIMSTFKSVGVWVRHSFASVAKEPESKQNWSAHRETLGWMLHAHSMTRALHVQKLPPGLGRTV